MQIGICFLLFLVTGVGLSAAGAGAQTPPFAITTGDGAIITDADLIEYRFAEHALKIRGEAIARLARLRPSVSGTPFHLEVNGERVYSGRFVSLLSSMSFKEPTVLLNPDTNEPTATVVIRGPFHHEPQFQTGSDPRIDPRISRALAGLGKLTAGHAGGARNDEAFTQRVADILTECQKLKPGMTRAEFLKTFEAEGGLRSPVHGTYVHRHCRHIKVDVAFAVSDPERKPSLEQPNHTLRSISKPYLAWNILD
jgi:hypothetical protein